MRCLSSLIGVIVGLVLTAILLTPVAGLQPPREFRSGASSTRDDRPAESQPAAGRPTLPQEWLDQITWRSIGPANMSGRITAIAAYEKDPSTFWVGTASGGLLKTTNNGVNFTHQFTNEATCSIGDVQVCQTDPNLVWVGTGEANPRNSVSWGNGVYKSTDGGETWEHMGLDKSFQIGRIAIHPTDSNIVFVGVLGRLWGPSEERGLYKTTDGGKTWTRALYVDSNTGVIDVQINPKDPNIIMAATYERRRDGFDGNDPIQKYGAGSGIYRSTDGGETFTKLSIGLPTCNMGRIGLDYYDKNPEFVYAIIETERIAQEPEDVGYAGVTAEDAEVGARITEVLADTPAAAAGLQAGDIIVSVDGAIVHSNDDFQAALRRRSAGDVVKLVASRERETLKAELTLAERPGARRSRDGDGEAEGESGESSRGEGRREGRGGPPRGANNPFTGTLGGQAENLQDQQGDEGFECGGVYMSKDGGDSWERINTLNPRPMYYSQVRVDPSNNKYVYVLGTDLYRSKDGGAEFTGDGGNNVHVDHHAMWIDPRDGRHMILGNDGGLYATYDRMDNWDHYNHVAIGQFYDVAVDSRRDYWVYGGLQDNGSWGGPSMVRYGGGPVNTDWLSIGGGDGFVCRVDPNDPDQIYFESQNGAMGRINLRTGERGSIRPRPERGVRYRFNWKTPFILSPHNSQIHYSAGNYVFRSLNKGAVVAAISPEITVTDQGTGSALAESPLEAGVLYAGTTDGALWGTRDGGKNWTELYVVRPPETESQPSGDEIAEDGGRRRSRRGAERGDNETATDEAAPRSDSPPATAEDKPPQAAPATETPPAAETPPTTETPPATETPPPATESPAGDLISGIWQGTVNDERLPPDRAQFTLTLQLADDGTVSGTYESSRGPAPIEEGSFDAASRTLTVVVGSERFRRQIEAVVDGGKMSGSVKLGDRLALNFEATRAKPNPTETTSDMVATIVPQESQEAGGVEDAAPAADDITGLWEGRLNVDDPEFPEEMRGFTMDLKLAADGSVTGTIESAQGQLDIAEGRYDAANKKLTYSINDEASGFAAEITATIADGSMHGDVSMAGESLQMSFDARRSSAAPQDIPPASPPADQPPTPQPSPSDQPSGQAPATPPAGQEPGAEDQPPADDPITGHWEGRLISDFMQGDRAQLSLELKMSAEGAITGTFETSRGGGDITQGSLDRQTGAVALVGTRDEMEMEFKATLREGKLAGTVTMGGGQFEVDFELTRAAAGTGAAQGEAPRGPGQPLKELIPGPRWVSSIEASRFQPGRVYITLDGHRSDDDEPYLFVSEDWGQHWLSVRGNLPTSAGSTRTLREDIANENVLYLGCEFSAWISIDRGKTWTQFKGGLPTVAVHEFAIHPTAGEIVAATHGRSLWIADITPVRQMSAETIAADVHLYEPNSVVRWRREVRRGSSGNRAFVGENPNSTATIWYSLGESARLVVLTINDIRGNEVFRAEPDVSEGLHSVEWDLRLPTRQPAPGTPGQGQGRGRGRGGFGGASAPIGTYRVTLNVDGQTSHQTLQILDDPGAAEDAVPASQLEQAEFDEWLDSLESEEGDRD